MFDDHKQLFLCVTQCRLFRTRWSLLTSNYEWWRCNLYSLSTDWTFAFIPRMRVCLYSVEMCHKYCDKNIRLANTLVKCYTKIMHQMIIFHHHVNRCSKICIIIVLLIIARMSEESSCDKFLWWNLVNNFIKFHQKIE